MFVGCVITLTDCLRLVGYEVLMIQGQISIFELLEQSSNSNKNCQDCSAWIKGKCRDGEMRIESYPKCINKDKWRKRITKWEANEPAYQKWLKAPEETFIFSSQVERKELLDYMGVLARTEYHDAHHVCKQMPSNIRAWLNSCNENYFVFTEKGAMAGEQHDICPYCGANLKKNEGDVILFRKHEKYWVDHLYWDKPMHEKGELTPAEMFVHRAKHKKHFGN